MPCLAIHLFSSHLCRSLATEVNLQKCVTPKWSWQAPSLPHTEKMVDPHWSYCACVSDTIPSSGVFGFDGKFSWTTYPAGHSTASVLIYDETASGLYATLEPLTHISSHTLADSKQVQGLKISIPLRSAVSCFCWHKLNLLDSAVGMFSDFFFNCTPFSFCISRGILQDYVSTAVLF